MPRRPLHHFADVFELAYRVVSYSTVNADGLVNTVVDGQVPILELCAITLATRQDELLHEELDVELELWTDSNIVLQYITNEVPDLCGKSGDGNERMNEPCRLAPCPYDRPYR